MTPVGITVNPIVTEPRLINIIQQSPHCNFNDQPGAKLWPLPQKQWEELQRYRPEVVFWCLGGNSIDKDISPAVIYHEIIELVDTLKQAGVKKVYVSEISERGNFRKSPGLTKEAFEEKRKNLMLFINMKFKDFSASILVM